MRAGHVYGKYITVLVVPCAHANRNAINQSIFARSAYMHAHTATVIHHMFISNFHCGHFYLIGQYTVTVTNTQTQVLVVMRISFG